MAMTPSTAGDTAARGQRKTKVVAREGAVEGGER